MKLKSKEIESPSPLLLAALSSKKTSLKYKAFYLVLILSLALNLYFVSSERESSLSSVVEVSLEQLPLSETVSEQLEVEEEERQAELLDSKAKSFTRKQFGSKPVARKNNETALIPSEERSTYKVKKATFAPFLQAKKQMVYSMTFEIENSLNYSVCKIMTTEAGCRQLSAHIGRLLAWNIDLNREILKGDLASVIYETLDAPEKFHVLKLTYKSTYHRKSFEANYYQIPGRKYGSYFGPDGREIHPRLTAREAPIRDFIEITSLPGDYRKGRFSGHRGTDFKAPTGTPIYAAFGGKVTRRNWNVRSNGYSLEIDHSSDKVITRYLHLRRTLVKPGVFVKQGQKIAESGNTGHSFAPHLHYEIEQKGGRGSLLNPFESGKHETIYLYVPEPRMEAYKQRVTSYDKILQAG